MFELANSRIAIATQELADLAGFSAVVNMKARAMWAGIFGLAYCALAFLLSEHLVVGAVGQAEPSLQRAIFFALWVFLVPLLVVSGMAWCVFYGPASSRFKTTRAAVALKTIMRCFVLVELGARLCLLAFRAVFFRLHVFPSMQCRWKNYHTLRSCQARY